MLAGIQKRGRKKEERKNVFNTNLMRQNKHRKKILVTLLPLAITKLEKI